MLKFKKALYAVLLATLTFCFVLPPAAEAAGISIYCDGELLLTPIPAVVERGVTLVPMRSIFEALGAQVDWYPADSSILAQKDGRRIALRLGDDLARLDDQEVRLQLPCREQGGYTLVPLRFVSEALVCSVSWLQQTNSVVIVSPAASQTSQTPQTQSVSWDAYYSYGMEVDDFDDFLAVWDAASRSLIPSFTVTANRAVYDALYSDDQFFGHQADNLHTSYYPATGMLTLSNINYLLAHQVAMLWQNPKEATKYASQQAAAYSQKIDELLASLVTDQMSDYQKELAIHDYMVKTYSYDERLFNGNMPDSSYSFRGLLDEGVGVCQAYSELFWLLTARCGIESYVVYGYVDNGDGTYTDHAWNIVALDGDYYQVDVTFDDPLPDRGQIYHDYFNLTDNEMAADHSWSKADYPAALGTAY